MLSLPVCALRSITTMQDLEIGEFDAQLEYAVLGLFASHSVPAIKSVTFRGNLSGGVALLACAHCTSSMPEASTNEPRYSPTFAQRHYYDFRFAVGLRKILHLLPVLARRFRHLFRTAKHGDVCHVGVVPAP
jgi:hypothetical protein